LIDRRTFLKTSVAAMIAAQGRLSAQQTQPTTRENVFLTDIPEYPGNILLARPTDHSVTLNVLSHRDVSACVEYGIKRGPLNTRTPPFELKCDEPREMVIDRLQIDQIYEYRLIDTVTNQPLFAAGPGAFRTARKPGSDFTFTIQADSHLDDGCRTDVYTNTLYNQSQDHPDFMIDMGDTSMAGKHPSRESALKQFLAQRYYFGLVGYQVPSFLLIGNHDGEEAKLRGATQPDGLAVWSNQLRKRYFTNPLPDRFYTGNDQPHQNAGLLQNYYAWSWGDAQFIVLDPYWTSSSSHGNSGGWNMSLGKRQYDWLTQTLRASKSKFKLVFIHQLVGGLDDAGRGGVEAAGFFEWGGCELDGRNTFKSNRPGWEMPVHDLLKRSNVTAVFHGHDHFFASQTKDQIHYILAPQAAHRNYRNDHAQEYGYKQGNFVPNSGHLRVDIRSDILRVQYIRSVPQAMQRGQLRNGSIAAAIEVHAG